VSIKFWLCLRSSTLLGLTVTVIAYLIAVTIVFAVLKITGTPYRICSDGAQFVHFLFGPATVALPLRPWR